MAKSESEIQAAVIRYARDNGVPHIRLTMRQGLTTGWPDVLFLIPGGKPLFMEFKAPGKKMTKVQEYRAQILSMQGYVWCACDNVSDGKAHINKCRRQGISR